MPELFLGKASRATIQRPDCKAMTIRPPKAIDQTIAFINSRVE